MPSPIPVACPTCSAPLLRTGRSYACANRHNFDLSKEGYLSLLQGRGNYQEVGDDKAMIQARVRVHQLPAFQGLAKAVAAACPAASCRHGILDIGCGDGFFLDEVTRGTVPAAQGVGVDISKEALAKAAKGYPELFFVRTDAAHQPLPFGSASLGLVLSIFAPRPIEEVRRVLRPEGTWLIVTATADHMKELREFLPLAAIGEGKLEAPTNRGFFVQSSETFTQRARVEQGDLVAIVEMSPSIFRLRREFGEEWKNSVPASLTVTVSIVLSRLVPTL